MYMAKLLVVALAGAYDDIMVECVIEVECVMEVGLTTLTEITYWDRSYT